MRPAGLSAWAAVGLAATLAGPVSAEGPVVVELFTSQGCSACPPADALLAELSERADVVALGLHVDYWDYLGWTDRFGDAANTRRQRGYVAGLGERSVYTPQIVIDGAASTVGSRREEVLEEIALAAAAPDAAELALSRDGDGLVVEVRPRAAFEATARLLYFIYERPVRVRVRAGENAGRTVVYHNVVRDWGTAGFWFGGEAAYALPVPEDARGVAVLLQADGGPVLAAAKLEFDAVPVSQAGPLTE